MLRLEIADADEPVDVPDIALQPGRPEFRQSRGRVKKRPVLAAVTQHVEGAALDTGLAGLPAPLHRVDGAGELVFVKALYDRDTRLAQRLEDRGGETPVIDVQMGEIERAVLGDQPPQVPARLRIVQEPPEL